MSKLAIENTTLTAIANATREKGGTTEPIKVSELANAISAIPTGGGTSITSPAMKIQLNETPVKSGEIIKCDPVYSPQDTTEELISENLGVYFEKSSKRNMIRLGDYLLIYEGAVLDQPNAISVFQINKDYSLSFLYSFLTPTSAKAYADIYLLPIGDHYVSLCYTNESGTFLVVIYELTKKGAIKKANSSLDTIKYGYIEGAQGFPNGYFAANFGYGDERYLYINQWDQNTNTIKEIFRIDTSKGSSFWFPLSEYSLYFCNSYYTDARHIIDWRMNSNSPFDASVKYPALTVKANTALNHQIIIGDYQGALSQQYNTFDYYLINNQKIKNGTFGMPSNIVINRVFELYPCSNKYFGCLYWQNKKAYWGIIYIDDTQEEVSFKIVYSQSFTDVLSDDMAGGMLGITLDYNTICVFYQTKSDKICHYKIIKINSTNILNQNGTITAITSSSGEANTIVNANFIN